MDSKHSTSSLGDWAFLVGSVGAVGAYFAYENMDAVNAWLMAMQTPAATQNAVAMATDVSLAAWMASNWGVDDARVCNLICSRQMGHDAALRRRWQRCGTGRYVSAL